MLSYFLGVSKTMSPNMKSSLVLSGDATMNSSNTAIEFPCEY